MRILNSLIVPKNVKGYPLRSFNIRSVAKYSKNERGLFGDMKKENEKSREESHSAKKVEKGDLSALEWVCISCKRPLDAFKIKY